MQILKENPTITLPNLKPLIKAPYVTIIIPPCWEFDTRTIFHHLSHKVFKVKINGKKMNPKEAIEKRFIELRIIVEMNLKNREWILITEDETYYSKGDNTN